MSCVDFDSLASNLTSAPACFPKPKGADVFSSTKSRMRMLLLDLRYATRSLGRTGGATLTAIITLVLGIASTTVVFSAVKAILLQPLPYPNAENLFVIHWRVDNPQSRHREGDISGPAFLILKDYAHSFESIAAVRPVGGVNVAGGSAPQYVRALHISENFFRTVGVQPILGKDFESVKNQSEGLQTVILCYGFWHRNFNDDRSALGRKLDINGESYTVVGVMPPGFRSDPSADIWLPLRLDRAKAETGDNYTVYATLRSSVKPAMVRQELELLSEKYHKEYRPTQDKQVMVVQGLRDFLVRDVRHSLLVLFGAVIFVLLIACTNVAAILVMRASSRRHEIAVRSVLGEPRSRLARRFLMESGILGLIGGVIGLILAKEALPWTSSLLPSDASFKVPISIDRRVLLFTLAVSLLSSLLAGLGPALRISSRSLNELLKQAPRGMTAGVKEIKLGRMLIFGQTALTIVLLSGALALLRGFLDLRGVAPGFDAGQVSVVQLSLAGKRYQTAAETARLTTMILDRVRDHANLESLGAINGLPMENGLNLAIYPEDQSDKIEKEAQYRIISGQYFSTLHIPIIQGRSFSPEDRRNTRPVAIINNALARTWWPQTSSLGKYVNVARENGLPAPEAPREVVGVVADVHERGLAWPATPTVFVPASQASDSLVAAANQWFLTSFVLRPKGWFDIAEHVQSAVASIDPDLPVAATFPMSQVVENSLAQPRFYASLISIFACLGLLLTTAGLYGLLNYQVGLRTRELAVRMAVGAKRVQAAGIVAREGVRLVGGGLVLGIAGAFFIKKLMASMLYGASGPILGPISMAAILLGLILTAAGMLIARRAVSIDPMVVLRDE